MLSIYRKEITETLCNEFCDGYTNEDNAFVDGMLNWIKKRIERELVTNLRKVKNRIHNKDIREFKHLLTDEKIREILSSKPLDLIVIWNEFKIFKNSKIIVKNVSDGKISYKETKLISHIFNYDSFRNISAINKFSGFILAKKLAVECCPYCNRNYTTTHAAYKEKKVFPEFDHFYHKSDYPLLSVSYYNLIPSCNVCNTHFKGRKDSIKEEIFHPYTEVMANHISFKFVPDNVEALYGEKDNFIIDFDYPDLLNKYNLEKTIKFFGLKEIYEICHTNLIKEMVNKKITFSNKYLQTIKDLYGISFEESYRILFETYYEDDKLHERPFSKLKKDIFDDINILSK
jgi:hypothetical protein